MNRKVSLKQWWVEMRTDFGKSPVTLTITTLLFYVSLCTWVFVSLGYLKWYIPFIIWLTPYCMMGIGVAIRLTLVSIFNAIAFPCYLIYKWNTLERGEEKKQALSSLQKQERSK